MSKTELTEEYKNLLYSKYNILGHLSFLDINDDFSILEKALMSVKKDIFEPNDRFILEHFDTDFYLEEYPYGFNIKNTFTAFNNSDTPLFTLLLITNHFGIGKEISALSLDACDYPTIIETFITKLHYTSSYNPLDVCVQEIVKPAICMLGANRSHRFALFNQFKEKNLLNNIAVSIKGRR
jgi:hypothetical protein